MMGTFLVLMESGAQCRGYLVDDGVECLLDILQVILLTMSFAEYEHVLMKLCLVLSGETGSIVTSLPDRSCLSCRFVMKGVCRCIVSHPILCPPYVKIENVTYMRCGTWFMRDGDLC